MNEKDEHIRGIASELFAHMPLDYHDTLKVLEHLRFLAEWRHLGARRPSPTDPNGRAGEENGGDDGCGRPQRDRDDPLGSNPKVRNISIVRPRSSPASI